MFNMAAGSLASPTEMFILSLCKNSDVLIWKIKITQIFVNKMYTYIIYSVIRNPQLLQTLFHFCITISVIEHLYTYYEL